MFEYYVSVLKNYANFKGRARRKEYWMFVLCNFIIGIVFGLLTTVVPVLWVLSLIYSLAILIPGLAVAVRRLHDTSRSGLWILISLVPLIGGIWLLVLMFLDGTAGDNKWGPDPKAAERA